MQGTAKDFLTVIRGEVGYVEGENNWTKYGEWTGAQNSPWCGQFISWCLNRAEVPGDWRGADSQSDVSAALERWHIKKRIVTTPRPGDLVFFNWPNGEYVDHMGATIDVINWEQGILITGEGNASDGVRIKTRYAENVIAFARPYFNAPEVITERERILQSSVLIRRGMDNHARLIKALQRVLKIKDDGIFGPKTEKAVKEFQEAHHLVPDGIVGPLTKIALAR